MSASKIVMKIVNISFSILVVVLVIFALFKVGGFAYNFGYRVYTEEPMSAAPGKDVVVEVEKGMSASELGNMLEDKHLVRDGKLFMVQLKLSSYSKSIKAGIYTLNTSMTSKEMMQLMSSTEDEETDSTTPSNESESVIDTETDTETGTPTEVTE